MAWNTNARFLSLSLAVVAALIACGPKATSGGSSGGGGGNDSTDDGATDGADGDTTAAETSGTDDGDPGETSFGETGAPPGCEDPRAIELEGTPTGFVACANGSIQRPEPRACAITAEDSCRGDEDTINCMTSADCIDGPNGACVGGCDDPECLSTSCGCRYECEGDDDCESGTVCRCRGVGEQAERNICIPATCTRDADCETGACGLSQLWWFDNDESTTPRMACRTDADTCGGDLDCPEFETCSLCPDDTVWDCHRTGYDCP